MARGFNKVILMGNLARDPEMRYTADQRACARFAVAVNNTWKDKSGASFALDYKGRSMEFTGSAQRVQRERDRKPLFSIANILR